MSEIPHPQRRMSYECDLCNRIFNYPSILKMHYRSHSGEKPFHCKFCTESFSYESHLIVHNQVHNLKEQYDCELCNKNFLHKSTLDQHIEVHKEEIQNRAYVKEGFPNVNGSDNQNVNPNLDKLHTCVICSEAFLKESELNRHSLAHKDGTPLSSDKEALSNTSKKLSVCYRVRRKQRSYICESCGTVFLLKENFETHVCFHPEDKPFECDESFSRKNHLNIHHRVHTNGGDFVCTTCGKLFSSKDKLNRHYRVHTNERPFQCNTCGKKFSRNYNLKVHYRIHTKERHFMCDTCGELFSRQDKLMLHYRVHTNERPFMCNTCGKVFSRKDELIFHHRVHIKTEPLSVANAVKNLCM